MIFSQWLFENEKMSKEQFRNWDFYSGNSMSPKRAFDIRETGDYETLYDISHYPDQFRFLEILGRGFDPGWNYRSKAKLIQQIKNNQPIPVYRSTDTGDILPGSYVTESKNYARKHGTVHLNTFQTYQKLAKPSELLSYGDPHEFIYLPDLDKAYEDYLNNSPI